MIPDYHPEPSGHTFRPKSIIARIYLTVLLASIEFGLRWNLAIGHWADTLRGK